MGLSHTHTPCPPPPDQPSSWWHIPHDEGISVVSLLSASSSEAPPFIDGVFRSPTAGVSGISPPRSAPLLGGAATLRRPSRGVGGGQLQCRGWGYRLSVSAAASLIGRRRLPPRARAYEEAEAAAAAASVRWDRPTDGRTLRQTEARALQRPPARARPEAAARPSAPLPTERPRWG